MQHLRPPQRRAGEMAPLHISTAVAALYQLMAIIKRLNARPAAPISLTQAGAFHAANSRATSRAVRMDIPTGPPCMKSCGIETDVSTAVSVVAERKRCNMVV